MARVYASFNGFARYIAESMTGIYPAITESHRLFNRNHDSLVWMDRGLHVATYVCAARQIRTRGISSCPRASRNFPLTLRAHPATVCASLSSPFCVNSWVHFATSEAHSAGARPRASSNVNKFFTQPPLSFESHFKRNKLAAHKRRVIFDNENIWVEQYLHVKEFCAAPIQIVSSIRIIYSAFWFLTNV